MEPVVVAVAQAFGITVAVLIAGDKRPPGPRARKVCCWLAKRLELRLTDTEIYRCLGVKRVYVPSLVVEIDTQRKYDPWLCSMTDRLLEELGAVQ